MDRRSIFLVTVLALAAPPLAAQQETTPATGDAGISDTAANDSSRDAGADQSKGADRGTTKRGTTERGPTVRGEYEPREKISEDGGVSFPADI